MAKQRGGKRAGSGRKPGSRNKRLLANLKTLDENKELIINKAILVATKKNPNTSVLTKLLDKLLPTLSSADIKNSLNEPFENVPEKDLEALIKKLANIK